MKQIIKAGLAAGAAIVASQAPAMAQQNLQKMINWCIGKNNPTPAQIAQGCSAVIASHKLKGEVLGTVYLNRGLAYKMMGQNDRALKEYNQAIELAPRYPLCYINRSAVYAEAGQYDLAVADSSKAISLSPKATLGYYNRGSMLLAQGKAAEAIADFDKAISLDAKYAPAFNNRAYAKTKLKDYDGAVADATMAIKVMSPKAANADKAVPYGTRAEAYSQKKDWPNAIKDISAAYDLDKRPQHLGIRSYYHEMNGHPELGLADLDRLLAANPKNASAYESRCWVNGMMNKLDAALADCNKSIELAPNVPNAIENRGAVELKMGDFDKAIDDFEAALKLKGYTPDGNAGEPIAGALYGRGLARQKKGDTLGGTVDVAAARKAKPDVAESYTRFGL